MATVTTSEFVKAREPVASFSMIEHKGILARLVEEASLALGDFTRDPRGFLREIFSDEVKDAQRSKRLRMGLAFGLAFQLVVIGAIAIAGWRHATASGNPDEPEYIVEWVDPKTPKPPTDTPKDSSTNKNDASGTNPNVSKGDPDAGSKSGGGGNENPAPPRLGAIPQSTPIPPIISPIAPTSQSPTVPVNPTIEGPEMPPPPPAATIGVPNGAPNSTSGGPGTGNSIGTGSGPGVGNKTGSGGGDIPGGNGPDGGTRSGPLGRPEGITLTGPIDYHLLKTLPGSTGIVWISRVRPIVTPEAQADRVVGYVLLEATFNANGTITDIRVRQSLGSMDEAAIESLRKARFRPATNKNGEPITLLRVPIKVNVNMS
jgi:TonB family protein